MMKNLRITDCYVQLILSHTESYGVISLHELEGNGVLHVFELVWISVRCRVSLVDATIISLAAAVAVLGDAQKLLLPCRTRAKNL